MRGSFHVLSVAGLCAIVLGVAVLAVAYVLRATTNAWLLTGLLLVLAGACCYLSGLKRGSNY